MTSRKMNLRDSEKVRHRAGGVGSERIRSGDVSEALTEVLREDIRFPPESSSKDGRRVEGKKAADHPSSNSPTGSTSEEGKNDRWRLQVEFVE